MNDVKLIENTQAHIEMSSMKTMYIMTELRVNDDIFTTKPEYQHQVFNGTPTDDHFIT